MSLDSTYRKLITNSVTIAKTYKPDLERIERDFDSRVREFLSYQEHIEAELERKKDNKISVLRKSYEKALKDLEKRKDFKVSLIKEGPNLKKNWQETLFSVNIAVKSARLALNRIKLEDLLSSVNCEECFNINSYPFHYQDDKSDRISKMKDIRKMIEENSHNIEQEVKHLLSYRRCIWLLALFLVIGFCLCGFYLI